MSAVFIVLIFGIPVWAICGYAIGRAFSSKNRPNKWTLSHVLFRVFVVNEAAAISNMLIMMLAVSFVGGSALRGRVDSGKFYVRDGSKDLHEVTEVTFRRQAKYEEISFDWAIPSIFGLIVVPVANGIWENRKRGLKGFRSL